MVSPLVSACGLAIAINCASNYAAQRLRAYRADVPFKFDGLLFFQFIFIAVLTTPPNYLWQAWLEKTFPGWKMVKRRDLELKEKKPGDIEMGDVKRSEKEGYEHKKDEEEEVRVRDWWNTFKKWFTDCITMGALLNTSAFLILMGLLKGKTSGAIIYDLRTEMWKIIWDSYKVWPIANFISTAYCPVEKRIVFLSVCGLVWSIYMSMVAAEL